MTTVAERKVLEEEFKWLLAQEYRTRVEAISIKLRECKTKFLEAISMRERIRPILLQNDYALCTAAIEGDKIMKAEINVKSGRGNKPVKTTIKEHHPWKLKQIQDASNYLADAYKWLDKVDDRETSSFKMSTQTSSSATGDETEGVDSMNQEGGQCSRSESSEDLLLNKHPAEIRKVFEELTGSLRKAESSLLLPHPISAAQIYQSDQKNALRQTLPEDTALNFHICSGCLVLSILTISQISRSQLSSQRNIPNQGLGTYWMGSTFEQGNSLYEVTHQIQVSSVIPWVSTIFSLVQSILELAQDFIDKVQMFETMGVSPS